MSDGLILPEKGLPAHLQGTKSNAGRLDNEEGLLAPPRLKLMQAMSGEVSNNEAKIGEYWSMAHSRAFAEYLFVPIRFEQEWVEFYGDDDEKSGPKWRTTDPNHPEVLALGDDAFRRKRLNVLTLGPIGFKGVTPKLNIFAFHGKGMPTGRSFYAEATRTIDCDYQGQVWKLTSEDKPGLTNKQKVKSPVTRFAGYCDEALTNLAMQAFKDFADQNLNPTYEGTGEGVVEGEKVEAEDDIPF